MAETCQVNPHVDNFVRSDLGIVGGKTGCCHPSDARVSRVCVGKNNAIFVCLENGRKGEIYWRKTFLSLVSDCGKQENEET